MPGNVQGERDGSEYRVVLARTGTDGVGQLEFLWPGSAVNLSHLMM